MYNEEPSRLRPAGPWHIFLPTITLFLLSAAIGYAGKTDYEQTSAVAVSNGIGVVGVGLITVGLWKALPSRATKDASGVAEQGN